MIRSFIRAVVPALTLVIASTLPHANAGLVWTWDSGTFENWTGYKGDTQISIEPGRNGTYGLGAVNGPPFTWSSYPIVEIANQNFNLNSLVGGQYGENLPMTSEIYVDVNQRIANQHGLYMELAMYGEWSTALFIVYPFDGYGTIENLSDGWYRYHFVNRSHLLLDHGGLVDRPPGTIQMKWKDPQSATTIPVVFDNLTISPNPVPEPESFLAFTVMAAITIVSRYRSRVIPSRKPRRE